jgi:L-ascorbate metabolism protein UlaG (beta-lactamase superfamily)
MAGVTKSGSMKITYYGHSCFELEINDQRVLLDPFISPNEKAASIDISKLNPDFILVSHGHADHVADVETIGKNSGAMIVSNYEVVQWFAAKGLENGHGMNIGGNWKFPFGKVKMVNAIHSSSMPDGSYGGNPAGFILEAENKFFYYAGDTALHIDMKQIRDDVSLELAFLPIGDNFTMGINDAVRAAEYSGARKVIGMHYDTFPPIEIDHDAAQRAFDAAGIELVLMSIGETINI